MARFEKKARYGVVLAAAVAFATLLPPAARADVISLECSGDVTGTFTFDLTGGTAATYDDDKTVDLTDVEISDSTIVFSQDNISPATEETASLGTSSRFRIDRQTNTIERLTYDYLNNKVTGETRATGQCKKVPTPHKPL
jgi:hypothetical protein